MSTRKPSATARQQLTAKKSKLLDLAPEPASARKVKGGPGCPSGGKGSSPAPYIGDTEKN